MNATLADSEGMADLPNDTEKGVSPMVSDQASYQFAGLAAAL